MANACGKMMPICEFCTDFAGELCFCLCGICICIIYASEELTVMVRIELDSLKCGSVPEH